MEMIKDKTFLGSNKEPVEWTGTALKGLFSKRARGKGEMLKAAGHTHTHTQGNSSTIPSM